MNVVPRLSSKPATTTPSRPATSNPDPRPVPRAQAPPPKKTADVAIDIEEEDDEEPVAAEPDKKSNGMNYKWVVLIVGVIIVLLILLVLFVTNKNDKYLGWLRGSKGGVPPPIPPQAAAAAVQSAPKSGHHSSFVANESADELAKYANFAMKKPVPVAAPAPMPVPAPVRTATLATIEEEPTAAAPLSNDAAVAAAFATETAVTGTEAVEEGTNPETSPIDEYVSSEIDKIEREKARSIQQVAANSEKVISTFADIQEVKDNNFDPEEVLKCCNGQAAQYKRYRWRFSSDSV